jgi:hypothetical protein
VSGRKVTGLPLPDTPREAPPELHGLVDAIEDELGESRVMGAVAALGHAFNYLTRYFAAVAGATAQILELEGETDVAVDFDDARQQLKDRLTLLGEKSTDPLSKLIRSVFYVGATRKTPTPRRHARLLDLGGIPIRGYLDLGDWIALKPGEDKELATDSKANRELLRYLPILKEWVTATKTFFLDCKQGSLLKSGDASVIFEITLGGTTRSAGPMNLPDSLKSIVFKHVAETEPKTEPPTVSAPPVSAQGDESEDVGEAVQESPQTPPERAESEAVEQADTESQIETVKKVSSETSAEPKIEAVKEVSAKTCTEPTVEAVEPVSAGASQSVPAEEQAEPEAVSTEAVEEPKEPLKQESSKSAEGSSDTDQEETTEPPKQPPQTVDLKAIKGDFASSEEEAATQAETEPDKPTVDPVGRTMHLSPEMLTGRASESEDGAEPSSSLKVPDAPTQAIAEPPKIEVMGLEPEPQAEALEPELEEPETEIEDQEPEPVGDGASTTVTERLALPESGLTSSLPEAPTASPAQPSAFPSRPDEDELAADPVLAALHAKPTEEPVEKKPIYPIPTGPAPEFFDEIAVEADYPEVLRMAITDLNAAVESNDSILICGQLQRCLDIMIQVFAGLSAAILMELDAESLFDFELEEGRFTELETKVELIVTALSALEEHWESSDAANLLWVVFYDTLLPATDPDCAYLHTRLLGVEGLIPEPYIEFVEFCQRVPGEGKLASQDHCKKVVHYYLPVLDFWLENAMPLFLESEIDQVEEEDGNAVSWAASVAGTTLDGTGSGFWIEVDPNRWNLPRPELAPVFVSGDAPEVLLPVFEELNVALEGSNFATAGLQCRIALDFLIQYFAGCAASLWRQQGEMSEPALALFYPEASLNEKERLLLLSLGGVSTTSDVGSSLAKLFMTNSLQYRALAQKGQPTGMVAISDWAAARDEVSEAQLVIYLPLLRSWIGAANPWFSSGEQLFEEPTAEGILEGVVAVGEDFLEMVDPEYVIQLPRECLELVAPLDELEAEVDRPVVQAETPFTGQLPQLPILTQGPPVLVGHVTRLLESAQDRRTSNAWLGSAFEYLIQYFAGMCTTVLGAADAPLPRDVMEYYGPSSSLRERELLLVGAVNYLKDAATGTIQESLRDTFFKPDGTHREHTKYLGYLGAGSLDENEMLLSYWCRVRHQAGSLSTPDLHFGTRVLNSWLDAAKPFFATCEHYAEEPGADGQEEMVVELADDYLDMVLPDYAIQIPARGYYEVLYKEPDAEALADMETYFPEDVRPTLLGPEEVVLGGAAGDGSDELLGAAESLGAQDLFGGVADSFDSDDLFAGSAGATQKLDIDDMFAGSASAPETEQVESSKEETKATKKVQNKTTQGEKDRELERQNQASIATKRRKKKARKQELGSAVLELYKKERLEKARKRAEARARKSQDDPTQISYSLSYRGLKNSKQLGGRGHFGLIELTNKGGGQLKGTVEPAHPCVRTQPTRFEGNEIRVTYQVDPADMPSTGRVGLTINTTDQRVELRLDELVPTSWLRERTVAQALGLLSAPSLIYSVWLVLLLTVILGPSVEQSIKFFGVNTSIDKMPWVPHLRLWSFSVLAILPGASAIPGIIKSLFARLDYTVQEESRWWLPGVMMLPTLIMLLVMYGTSLWTFDVPPGRLPPLASRLVLTVLTFGLNLLATSLFSLQTTMWWEDRSDSKAAKGTFIGFWSTTIILGVVVTFFMW